jgi:hypothetical protein
VKAGQKHPKTVATIGHVDHGKALLTLALDAGVLGSDPPRVPYLPKKDCLNCEYMALWEPGDSGHCYMFQLEPPHETCGQFRPIKP